MSAFSVTLLVLCVVLMVRNELTGRMTKTRLAEIHEKHLRQIDAGIDPDLGEYDRCGPYCLNVFDLRKWTYRQFFPEAL